MGAYRGQRLRLETAHKIKYMIKSRAQTAPGFSYTYFPKKESDFQCWPTTVPAFLIT